MAADIEARVEILEAENLRLRSAVAELSILNEVASTISSTASLDKIVTLIVRKCVKHLDVEQGAVLLFEQGHDENAALRTMVRKVRSDYDAIPYRLGDQITGWMLKKQEPLLIPDLSKDDRFTLPAGAESVRGLLCVPLRLKGTMLGVLAVFNKRGREGFSEADERLLTIIAAQSAQVIENARLYEEEKAFARFDQELRTAREIQLKLLPKEPPRVEGFDIAGRSRPARSVGGDYFDFLDAGQGRIGLCLGDVSGKGVSAALLMANVQATIRSQNLTSASVAERLDRANRLLYDTTESDKFVTLFHAILNPVTGRLDYSNAGHNPPALFSAGAAPTLLDVGGPVLGVLPRFAYEQASLDLKAGDLLLIYSDGFSEAMNLRDEEFGEERLHQIVAERRGEPAEKLIDRIFAETKLFCGEAPQSDDMTIVVVRCTG